MELWAPRSVEAALPVPPPDGSGRHRFSADLAGTVYCWNERGRQLRLPLSAYELHI
jgi:hypothetical protein